MRLRAGAASDRGRHRELNEDAFVSRPAQGLFVVCDGMGGAAAGEVASQLAVQTILEQQAETPEPGPPQDGYLPQTARLAEVVRRANQAIYDQALTDAAVAGMGTTVVGAVIANHVLSVAHVGDSRAYLWHEGQIEPLTIDHSLVEAEVRAGLVDREQSLQSEHQNVLLRALGRELDVEVELAEVPVQPGDYVLLCSDGLTRMVTEQAMAGAITDLREPQAICDRLIAAANDSGGVDNITVIVVAVSEDRWEQMWNRWTR